MRGTGQGVVEDNAKMRDRLTKLETLVEMLMKKRGGR